MFDAENSGGRGNPFLRPCRKSASGSNARATPFRAMRWPSREFF